MLLTRDYILISWLGYKLSYYVLPEFPSFRTVIYHKRLDPIYPSSQITFHSPTLYKYSIKWSSSEINLLPSQEPSMSLRVRWYSASSAAFLCLPLFESLALMVFCMGEARITLGRPVVSCNECCEDGYNSEKSSYETEGECQDIAGV